MPPLHYKARITKFFSKNRKLAKLRQHGFLNEKNTDFLNVFFLGGGEFVSNNYYNKLNYLTSYSRKANGQKMPPLHYKARITKFFSKNRKLAKLRQYGFLNEKNTDFLNVFFLGGGNPFQTTFA